MKNVQAVLALAAAGGMLGGCQSIAGAFGLAKRPTVEIAVPEVRSAAQELADGRGHLEARRYGQAIVAFREAAIETRHAAPAHNGLAIAYAGLGRSDLAERYFRLAISEAPENERYTANLNRLFATTAIALTQESRHAALQAVQSPAQPVPEESLSATGTGARLVRSSAYEVRIVLPPPMPAAPRRAAARSGRAAKSSDSTYPVRMKLGPDGS